MLQAISKDGKRVTLAMLPRNTLRQLRNSSTPFYCPVCKQKVIMKIGNKVIPHFAHQRKEECPSSEAGEGLYHEEGKLLLYQWLRRQGLNVQLEMYIPDIKQRPDLLLHFPDRKIAIEFQCSKIPKDEINARTEGYLQMGIVPFWILGLTRMRQLSPYVWKIDAFTRQLIHQYTPASPLTITYFCPLKKQFLQIHYLTFSQMNRAIGKMERIPLEYGRFRDLFSVPLFPKESFLQVWYKEKLRFRTKRRENLYGNELIWRQWLYSQGVYLEQLPSIVHLPVRSQFLLKVSPWNWQSRLYFKVLEKCQVGNSFSLRQCERILRPYFYSADTFPLISKKDNPIEQYLRYWEKLHIVEKRSPEIYVKLKEIPLYTTLNEAIQGDRMLIKKLIRLQLT